jgi:osmotically-inducible protein OsmY
MTTCGGTKVGLVLSLAVLAGGCGREHADRLARVGRLTAARLGAATGGARGKLADGLDAVRGALGEASADSRVTLRLRWDKMLAGADVHVSAAGPGVVRLEGTVADHDQRSRAVGLAESTEGVEQVIDALALRER